jgi:hypothetical protein
MTRTKRKIYAMCLEDMVRDHLRRCDRMDCNVNTMVVDEIKKLFE